MTPAEQAAYDKIAHAVKGMGVSAMRIWACPECGQKNRVDAVEVVARAARPKCGKCGAFLRDRGSRP